MSTQARMAVHQPKSLRSMTAFARQSLKDSFGQLTIEIRSVNHRFLDISLRMPETLRELDNEVRDCLRGRLERGKIEVNVRFEPGASMKVDVNQAMAQQLLSACEQIQQLSKTSTGQINITEILAMPGVVNYGDINLESLKPAFMKTLNACVDELVDAREREGQALSEQIAKRLDGVEALVNDLRPHLADALRLQREKMILKIDEMKLTVDPARIEQELVLWAQRADVSEEMDRLEAHIKEARRGLAQGGALGRRFDFLMQEFNRETNTLSSKSSSLFLTNAAVEMKVLIEQMREQVQNIE